MTWAYWAATSHPGQGVGRCHCPSSSPEPRTAIDLQTSSSWRVRDGAELSAVTSAVLTPVATGPAGRAQRPVHSGGRFSMKATSPSLKSSLFMAMAMPSSDRRHPVVLVLGHGGQHHPASGAHGHRGVGLDAVGQLPGLVQGLARARTTR